MSNHLRGVCRVEPCCGLGIRLEFGIISDRSDPSPMRILHRSAVSLVLAGSLAGVISSASLASDAVVDNPTLLPPPAVDGVTVQTAIHGQSTLVIQSSLPFPSLVPKGDQSLSSNGETKHTLTATLAAGVRLWPGAELYFNPEVFQGFGLDGTRGVASFPNGEAQKGGTVIPTGYIARLFLRQTWGFGGEREVVKDDFNQLGGTRDVNRLTVTVGKLSISDVFDTNGYAGDPRDDFLNWALWDASSFDYAANLKGYSWGAMFDLNRMDWAFRAGYFLEPVAPSVDPLDTDVAHKGELIAEIEHRGMLLGLPGVVRVAGWFSRANSANFDQALALSASSGLSINDATVANRTVRTKFGVTGGFEQALTNDVGIFSRIGWTDGRNEDVAFTDADWSASLGLIIRGTAWGRPDDKVGAAIATNGLSGAHRAWFNAGANGLVIGDGKLAHYGEEQIFETFYNYKIRPGLALSADAQLIDHPAYNADRGPVGILASRLHANF